MSFRDVPVGWIEFTDTFIDEVRLGVHPGWTYHDSHAGEALTLWEEGESKPSGAWEIKRDRVLGKPLPLIEGMTR